MTDIPFLYSTAYRMQTYKKNRSCTIFSKKFFMFYG